MKDFLTVFFTWWWIVWLLMLVIMDPIAMMLGKHYGVGDQYTDTHFIVRHINLAARGMIIGWLMVHFLVQHVKD